MQVQGVLSCGPCLVTGSLLQRLAEQQAATEECHMTCGPSGPSCSLNRDTGKRSAYPEVDQGQGHKGCTVAVLHRYCCYAHKLQ